MSLDRIEEHILQWHEVRKTLQSLYTPQGNQFLINRCVQESERRLVDLVAEYRSLRMRINGENPG